MKPMEKNLMLQYQVRNFKNKTFLIIQLIKLKDNMMEVVIFLLKDQQDYYQMKEDCYLTQKNVYYQKPS